MSDDIVSRLRAHYCFHDSGCNHLTQDSADEIEGLRRGILFWETIARCSYCEPQHNYYCTKHREESDE